MKKYKKGIKTSKHLSGGDIKGKLVAAFKESMGYIIEDKELERQIQAIDEATEEGDGNPEEYLIEEMLN